ncbi:MAG: UDP-3-O-(3-hydroxymyristoyl)glucosamine N-acyltransferase, partial [Pirellulaceae bacterium]|nr:UDP-3-O-(3-hydroxymyristoyl)glucosamine N-acyltransferase [Pirellulaceae bacterium]
DDTTSIAAGAWMAAGASIGANCTVGRNVRVHGGVHIMANCHIGDDCEFFPGVVLYPNTRVGHRCTFHAGTVLGANGFGYRTISGQHHPASQLGWVEIGDDVELGACVTIDRGTYGATRVGTGTKIDNQVMIGHNCKIGKHNLICAQVGIAGSSSTGDYVVLAGQVGIKDHIQLGDRVVVAAQSGVMHNLTEPGVWCGTPAVPIKKHMQSVAHTSRLAETRSELKRLEAETQKMREEINKLLALHGKTLPSETTEQRAA